MGRPAKRRDAENFNGIVPIHILNPRPEFEMSPQGTINM